jgi:hypothetical protein
VFLGEDWAVSSQQPPTPADGDLRRLDIIAENWDNHSHNFTRFLLAEGKHANPTPEELRMVEYQGSTGAVAYCESYGVDRAPVLTFAGRLARLWVYDRREDYLTP